MTRLPYRPSAPIVRCPACGRLIGTRSGKFPPHHASKDATVREPLCQMSGKPVGSWGKP